MHPSCPDCKDKPQPSPKARTCIRSGKFYRKSDSRWIQRFTCTHCRKSFSRATPHPCYQQNKRHLNHQIAELLCSGLSQRRLARILHISRTTVARKLCFLGGEAASKLTRFNQKCSLVQCLEFDDVETIEHSKCKPLSITLAVESKTRRILGFGVAVMPAKGPLAAISRKKYGKRPDHRPRVRGELFKVLQPLLAKGALIKSDESPHYPKDVKRYFPASLHQVTKGQRGCIGGQGELKKIGFDPLFSLNHTAAMLRANINRLFRRTWCTTKKKERLALHLSLYALYHNECLINAPQANV